MTLSRWDRYDPDGVSGVGDRAVVVGGSLAGLCAARVLADGFEKVVVLERDEMPDGPVARDGAPQTSHPHILLEAGRATLEDFFPGFSEALTAAGGLVVDTATDMTYFEQGGTLAAGPERLPMYCASRPLIEHVVRQQVEGIERVDLRWGHQFTNYRMDDAGGISGIECRDAGGTETAVDADLVVDATGRTSRTPEWLAANGYARPSVDEVRVDISYSTIRVERPPDDQRVLTAPPSPPRTRGGGAIPVEGGRWEVTIQGIHGDDPPTDPDGFVEFAESLPLPELSQVVTEQPWISEVGHRYPFPASMRRRYETLDRFPDGLAVVGDAIASFNPIYGQGISVAALEAQQLHQTLAEEGLSRVGPRFFDRAGPLVDTVWKLAVGADFKFSQTTGAKPFGTGLLNRYVARLIRQAHSDGVLTDAFLRVFRLEESPTYLFRPSVVRRVLFGNGNW